MFSANRVFPQVTHITDAMGVSFTLVEGEKQAVLFHAGYGTEDVAAYVRTLTDKPVDVLLSHGHHDHILGARWFMKSRLAREDLEEFRLRTGEEQRKKVKRQAADRGVSVPGDFLEAVIPAPEIIDFPDCTGAFQSASADLGGLEIRIIHVPGHTPGSIVVYIPAYSLLLTGDNWNPCTWMWFPTSAGADQWRDNMLSVISALEENGGDGIRYVLCSHQPMLREGKELKGFLSYMTDGRMQEAPAEDMGAPINTHRIEKQPEGWMLIFDREKIRS